MKTIVVTAVRPVMLTLCLFLCACAGHAQPRQEQFQTLNMRLSLPRSARSFEPVDRLFVRCPKKKFGLRISGTIGQPTRDRTATRVAFGISIKPFLKPKTQQL